MKFIKVPEFKELQKGDIEILVNSSQINLLANEGKKMICCNDIEIFTINNDTRKFTHNPTYPVYRKITPRQ